MKKIYITILIILLVITGTIVLSNINQNADVSIYDSSNDLSDSHLLEKENNKTKGLIGTWIKQETFSIENHYPNDNNWELKVTFNNNKRFIWDSKRKESDGNTIDESLTGTYTTEQGFLISYTFEKPSNQVLERIPELFAFWPNKLLGQQTFRFDDDYLILGHDGNKLWFYMKRKERNS